MAPQIVAIRGPLAGRSFPLTGITFSFGRTPENTVVIASPLASRRHVEVRLEAGAYVLYDLGSSNGTRVNGQPATVHRLSPGDLFEIGDEAFRFEIPAVYGETVLTGAAMPQPPVSGGALHQPLPPLPSAPQAQWNPPPPPPRRSRLPMILSVVTLLGCVVVAALAGGFFLIGRGLDPVAPPTAGGGGGGGGGAPVPTFAPAGAVPTRAPLPAGAAKWTILVYLDGDNNLEADALNDFREMARVGSSDQLKIVVQLDRISSSEAWDDTSAGDWKDTKRFLVARGMEPTAEAAVQDMGELNMGDQGTLADFIEWGVGAYPAEHYALVIWDHGASWMGIASDDTNDGMLHLPELSAALETARQRSGYGMLDLIGFDACLMAQLDVFKAIAPYGKVVVASAEMEPNQGWAWDTWFASLVKDPEQDAYATAPVVVDTYIKSYAGTGSDDVTLSAFDLTQIGQVTQRLDELAGAMIDGMGAGYSAIAQARSFASSYPSTNAEEFNAIDLGHFVRLLPEQGATGQIATAAAALDRSITQARLANGAGSYHSDTSGISIYFPQTKGQYISAYERGSPLPRQTRWADFLKAFPTAGQTAVTKPTISGMTLSADTVSGNSPVTLSGSIAGQDIAYVFWFIGIPNAARDTVDLINVDFFYPPGVRPGSGTVPSWESGQHPVSLTWDATNWYLSNGDQQIEVVLGSTKYGSNFYGVEGVYTSQATGEQIDAGLIFTVSADQGHLTRIWAFPKGSGSQQPQPYELEPVAGDTFTAYLRSYTDTGTSLKPAAVKGQTLTFGDAPMTAHYGPTANGNYVMGFLVRDIAGNFSYDYLDVTVANP